MRTRIALVLAGLMLATLGGLPSAAEVLYPGCADADQPGGEWRSLGGGLDGARNQRAEGVINAGNAGNLDRAWIFDASTEVLNGGGFSNTPIVADGCVYLATSTGWVFALNAETGDVVWHTEGPFKGAGQTLLGGIIVGSPVVAEGVVYVGVSRPGTPYVAAIDQATGDVLWESTVTGWHDAVDQNDTTYGYKPETKQNNVLINASPIYYAGKIFMGFAGNEGGSVARGGFAILDASAACTGNAGIRCLNPGGPGGTVLAHTYTISDAEYAAGYRGASVWCTPAIDVETDMIFACGGNPASKRIEHRFSNALLKIDGRSGSPAFGQIVGSFKGNNDQYFPGLDRQPVCELFGEDIVVVWSLACLQLDLDFGASPNLWKDALGNTIVGDLQKSGVYYALYADHMSESWSQILGGPCLACNAGSPAIDDAQVYNATTPNGQLVAVSRDAGKYRWAMPLEDQVHFHPTSVANGVVYAVNGNGAIQGFEAATGVPVWTRLLAQDVGGPISDTGSSGISVARNTVYAAFGTFVIAYR